MLTPSRPLIFSGHSTFWVAKPVHSTTTSTSASVPSAARTPVAVTAVTGAVTRSTSGRRSAANQPLSRSIRLPNGG